MERSREELERVVKLQNEHEKRLLHNRRIMRNHIIRLRETNQELGEVLAIERKLRKEAYDWYREQLSTKWWRLFYMVFADFMRYKK